MDKAFIRVIEPEDAEGSLKRAYKRVGGSRGSIANVHQSQSLHPKAMLGHLDLYMALMYDKDSPLTRRKRELIGTLTSVLNNCDYCIKHHYEALLVYWDDAPTATELIEGEGLDKQDKVLLAHVIKLVKTPWLIGEEDINRLLNTGFDDRAILDITMITGYFCFVNRLTLGLGVKMENKGDMNYNY